MPRHQALVERVGAIAASKGATPAQIAPAWLLAQESWTAPIAGTTKLHRLEENLGRAGIEPTESDPCEIADALDAIAVQGDRYSGSSARMVDR